MLAPLLLSGALFSRIFFSSMTRWGPAAHTHFDESNRDVDVFMMRETHVGAEKIQKVRSDVAGGGWELLSKAAAPSTTSEAGTEFTAVKTRVAATGYDALRARHCEAGGRGPFVGFSALSLHAKSGHIVWASAYLVPQAGLAGANFERARSLAGFAESLAAF